MPALAVAFVRVRPDLAGFRQEAARQLGRIRLTKPVTLTPDASAFREQAIARLARVRLAPIRVPVNPDTTGLGRTTERAVRPAGTRAGQVFSTAMTDRLNTQLRTLNLPELNLKANSADMDRAITATREHLQLLVRDASNIELRMQSGQALAELTRFDRSLRRTEAQAGESGDRAGRLFGSRMARGVESSNTFSRVAAIMASRVGVIAAAFGAALPAVIQWTAALAPAAGLVAGLPAGLLGARAAVLTFKLAVDGVGQAISAGLTGTAAQAAKALQALPPPARAFAREVIALKPRIDALRASVAGRFFAPLTDEVRPLAQVWMPLLQREMGGLGGAMGGFGQQVAITARQATVMQGVTAIFDGTRRSVTILRAAVDPLGQAFGRVLSATAGILPQLSGQFVILAQRVAAWLSQAARSGQLMAIWNNAMVVLRQLGTVALNVGSILGSIFSAASNNGAGLLATLGRLTGQAAAFLRTAQGAQMLQTIFATLSVIGAAMSRALGALLPAIARSVGILAPALSQVAGTAAQFVVALAPALPAVAQLAASLVGSLLPALNWLAGLLTRHEGLIKVLVPSIVALRLAFLGLNIAMRLNPIGIIITAIVLMISWTVRLWQTNENFRNQVLAVWGAVKTAIGAVANWFSGTIAPSIQRASQQAVAAWTWLRNTATTVWGGITGAVRGFLTFLGTVARVAQTAWNGLVAGVNTVYHVFDPVWHAIARVVQAAGAVIQLAVAIYVAYLRNVVGPAIMWLWRTIFAPAFGAIRALVSVAIAGVRSVLNGAVGFIRGPVASGVMWLWRTIFAPAWAAMRAITNVAVGGIRALLTGLINHLRGPASAAFTFFRGVVSSIMGTVRNVISSGVNAARGFLNSLGTFVRVTLPGAFRTGVAAITSAWDKVKAAAKVPVTFVVRSVINPLINGFNAVAKVFHTSTIDPIHGFAKGGQVTPELAAARPVLARARGGIIPGAPSDRDNRLARLIDGGGRMLGNLKVATGEFVVNAAATARNLPLLRRINADRGGTARPQGRVRGVDTARDGLPQLLGGLQFGGLIDWAKGLVNKGKAVVSKVLNVIADPSAAIRDLANRAINAIPGGGAFRDVLVGMGRSLVTGVINKIKSFFTTGGVGGIAGNASPGFPPWPSSPGAQRGDSGVWRNIVALIKSTGPISGSFGNAYRPGDPLWHGSGRAVDWMGFNQDALATFLAGRRPLELIHRTGRRDYAYTRGRNKGSFNNALMQAHRNHVHIAMKLGGLLARLRGRAGAVVKLMDRGGAFPSGTAAINTSGHTEQVLTGGPGGDIAELTGLLAQLLTAVRGLGADVADALERPTRRAVQLGRTRGTVTIGRPA
jgi:phage-related protein